VVSFHVPAALPPGKEPPVPIGQEAGSGGCGIEREKKNLSLLGIEPRPSSP
jgi:hypothetical protein